MYNYAANVEDDYVACKNTKQKLSNDNINNIIFYCLRAPFNISIAR